MMKKKKGISLFLGAQLVIILLYIYQENLFIRVSYQQQKLLKQKVEVFNALTTATHELQALKKRSAIKKFAQNSLKLKSVPLASVRSVPHAG